MRVSCWIDEPPPPNGSDPVHEGGTVSKDKVFLFPLGLLECLLAAQESVRLWGHSSKIKSKVSVFSEFTVEKIDVDQTIAHIHYK